MPLVHVLAFPPRPEFREFQRPEFPESTHQEPVPVLVTLGKVRVCWQLSDSDKVIHRERAKGQLHQWTTNIKGANIYREAPRGLK